MERNRGPAFWRAGKNRRMNGRKKAFLTYQGSAFLDVIRGEFTGILPDLSVCRKESSL